MKPDLQNQLAWASTLQLVAARSETALAVLYAQTSTYVYATVARILTNQADAEEITLDVYVQVWNGATRYEPARGTPLSWLLTMARSRALDRLRLQAEPCGGLDPNQLASPARFAEPGHNSYEQWRWLRHLLSQLPEEQRVLIDAAYFAGMSQAEMAARLQLPLGTVKTRVRLGLRRLRTMLESTSAR